jgi:adenine-specific DNA-methyltransferase
MEKLKLHSPDLTQANIEKLAQIFPTCVAEFHDADGTAKRSIDFDQLRQELSGSIVEGPQERYQLNWPGKRAALLTANSPIAKTLRPCREESVDFDSTQNLFIEGDNLDALKLLQETYLNKVKLIYIDPPYNTGNDFIYEDDFAENSNDYLERSNQKDVAGNQMIANTEANGRFHSDWLTMMYPRLKLARNLLREDGAIFISIDDNEQANLKRLCDEIFGEENFVANVVWQKKYSVSNDDPGIAPMHDHVVVFQKSASFNRNLLPRNEKQLSRYKNIDNDPRGVWTSGEYVSSKTKAERPTLWYAIKHPRTGEDVWPDENAVWRYSKDKHEQIVAENRLHWGPNESYQKPRIKRFLSEIQDGTVPSTWWPFDDVGHNDEAQKETADLIGKKVFSTPKPVRFIRRVLDIATSKDDVVLDFFAGSAASAHAVMSLNAEDLGQRRFVMVQLPEACDEKSEALNVGFKTIAEVSKERIRRAGKKIKAESSITNPGVDVGFRVLKIDSSNMKEVFYTPDAVSQDLLSDQVNNIREDRTSEDLLFQVLLDWGVDLTLPITQEIIANKTVYFVDGNALAACFEEGVSEEFVKSLAKREPLRVVFRDSGFVSDSVKINVEQIFKLISPTTQVKSI